VASVGIHPPKTPVTTGSYSVAKATLPNICKMPGPPAPFVPMALPNIAKSDLSPKGFSKTVKIEGHTVAIRGATFESIGDIASKATGGGLISANTHGPAKFITPGSMTVKIEGKSVHLLGEPMLNNCGPSGSPPNTGATMGGVKHRDTSGDESEPPPECADGDHVEVVEYPQVPGDERGDPEERIAVGRQAAVTEGDEFEMAAAEANFRERNSEIKRGNQISRNLTEREEEAGEKGDSQKAHLVCTICGKRREVDQVLNRRSTVEAKSGDPRDPAQIKNNKKFVQDGGTVTYKLPAPVIGRDGFPTQRAQALMNDGFRVVGVPFSRAL
jgi:uncharacterized Zn-binding protein involved in type VI secretion